MGKKITEVAVAVANGENVGYMSLQRGRRTPVSLKLSQTIDGVKTPFDFTGMSWDLFGEFADLDVDESKDIPNISRVSLVNTDEVFQATDRPVDSAITPFALAPVDMETRITRGPAGSDGVIDSLILDIPDDLWPTGAYVNINRDTIVPAVLLTLRLYDNVVKADADNVYVAIYYIVYRYARVSV